MAVSITWICERFRPGGDQPDVDNIAKPIVDALKDVVYVDDARITDVLCRRRSPAELLAAPVLSLLPTMCATRPGDSTYIVAEKAPVSEVHLQWRI